MKAIVVLLMFLAIGSLHAAESVYTDLSEKMCPVVERDQDSGSTRQLCSGVEKYKLVILSDDARVSINIIAPDGKEFPLNFWEVVSSHFTSHDEKAEWRVVKKGQRLIPQALIVRVKAFEYPESPEKFTSYLTVSKITPDQVCITDKIAPGPKQIEMARHAADIGGKKSCLEVGGK